MPFGNLSGAQQIMVRLYLLGGPKYRVELEKAGLATKYLTSANAKLGATMAVTNKRSFLHNQLLFMARRGLFYATLGTIGLTAATAKLGFTYLSTKQQVEVALRPVFKNVQALQMETQELFKIAALTPFTFQQVTQAFRLLYAGFRPLGLSVETVNDLLRSTTDIMSFMGTLTPNALKRVSLGLQDMANQTVLTGRSVYNLSQLGIPLREILRKELHLTGQQMQSIGSLGIPAQKVIQAIISYAQSTPGVFGAALRQSNQTLFGAWSTFKDLLSQAVGESESGIFGFVQKTLVGINAQVQKGMRPGKPVAFSDLIKAIDTQLTPKTHIVLNLFIMLNTAITTTVKILGGLLYAVQTVLIPLDKIAGIFGASHGAAKLLGYTLGVLTAVVLLGAGAWVTFRLAADAAKLALFPIGRAIKLITTLQAIQTASMEAGGLINAWRTWASAETHLLNESFTAVDITKKETGVFAGLSRVLFGKVVPAVEAVTIALGEMTLAEWGVYGAAAALIILFGILYWKWKDFRTVVNRAALALADAVFPVMGLYNAFKLLYNIMQLVYNLARHPIKTTTGGKGAGGFFSNVINLAKSQIPFGLGSFIPKAQFAGGGVMPYSGVALVGERGPEIVHLPGGSRVVPNAGTVAPVNFSRGDAGSDKPIVVQLVVDRKVLAQAVARAREDHAARR